MFDTEVTEATTGPSSLYIFFFSLFLAILL